VISACFANHEKSSPMVRRVVPEILDTLPPSDALAIGSRRDLQRLNGCMGNARFAAPQLSRFLVNQTETIVSDLGAGDGTFSVSVARSCPRETRANLNLVDRQATVSEAAGSSLRALGWNPRAIESDVFDYLENEPRPGGIMCNLFLHHFEPPALRRLLDLCSRRARFFIACEPRRSWASLWVSRCLFVIGCNEVTRHDAPISVRAGFRGSELAALWPAEGWRMEERRAGLFTHVFVAVPK
jgi:hypothetical protein